MQPAKRRRKSPVAGLPKAEIRLHRELAKASRAPDIIDLFGEQPSEELRTPYTLVESEIDQLNTRNRTVQNKYDDRESNVRRCWNRVQLYLPELLSTRNKHDILEMSTAHGGMLEVLRHYGHRVTGNDYVNMVGQGAEGGARALFREVNDTSFSRSVDDYGLPIPDDGEIVDWPYRKIIEAIDIPMALFDAGRVPYPFDDKSFDVVMCFQAIEHYCHPKDWMKIIDEFCRLSRKTIFVLLNPMLGELADDPAYSTAFHEFRKQMRDFNRNGFQCVSCHVHWGQALGFKLMASTG